MSSILASFISLIVIIPMLGYLLVFSISKTVTNNHRQSVLLAVDCTTFLLIIAIHFLSKTIWERSFLPFIILLILIIAASYAIYYWRTRDDMEIVKILRGCWRANFLIFFVLYILLFFIGIIKSIIS